MCYTIKPWDKEDVGHFLLFTGILKRRITKKDETDTVKRLESRRFDSDKIQKIELMSKVYGQKRVIMLVI